MENSKEIYEEISFPPFFQKNADVSIFVDIQGWLSRKNAWLPQFSFVEPLKRSFLNIGKFMNVPVEIFSYIDFYGTMFYVLCRGGVPPPPPKKKYWGKKSQKEEKPAGHMKKMKTDNWISARLSQISSAVFANKGIILAVYINLSFDDWRVIWTKSFFATWKCHPSLGKINFASIQSFFSCVNEFRDWSMLYIFFQWQRHKLQLIHALSCASSSYDIVCDWRVWSGALKKLEQLSAAPQAGLVPLLYPPKSPPAP